ncbi:hypothetical protein B0H21DRAFT_77070 [Amylocystis lapponica]|nr:hypothetical protein B0H21DRAFT_77070 [Amylocystis lapponica]
MSRPLDNLRAAHEVLRGRVERALRTQLGDSIRLGQQRAQALSLLEAAELHQSLFPPAELATLRSSIALMISCLDQACHASSDPPDAPSLMVTQIRSTGRRGRPRIEIDSHFLRHALELRGPSQLSSVLGCSSRTVRRRALDYEHAHTCRTPALFPLSQTMSSTVRSHLSWRCFQHLGAA